MRHSLRRGTSSGAAPILTVRIPAKGPQTRFDQRFPRSALRDPRVGFLVGRAVVARNPARSGAASPPRKRSFPAASNTELVTSPAEALQPAPLFIGGGSVDLSAFPSRVRPGAQFTASGVTGPGAAAPSAEHLGFSVCQALRKREQEANFPLSKNSEERPFIPNGLWQSRSGGLLGPGLVAGRRSAENKPALQNVEYLILDVWVGCPALNQFFEPC